MDVKYPECIVIELPDKMRYGNYKQNIFECVCLINACSCMFRYMGTCMLVKVKVWCWVSCFIIYFLRQGVWLNLELYNSARLAGQKAPWASWFLPSQCKAFRYAPWWAYFLFFSAENTDASPHAPTESTLPAESASQHQPAAFRENLEWKQPCQLVVGLRW